VRYLAHITLLLTVLLSASALAADIPPPGELSSLQRAHYEHRAGYHLHIAEEYEAALKRYEISAATGLAKSENAIGRILGFDRKPVQDLPAALPWFIRAAAPRDVHQGYGFAESQRQAKETLNWYCKNGAGEFPDTHPFAKDPKCWHGRGKALMYGWFGMRKDREAARALFEKSIAAGCLSIKESSPYSSSYFWSWEWSLETTASGDLFSAGSIKTVHKKTRCDERVFEDIKRGLKRRKLTFVFGEQVVKCDA